VFSFKLAPVVQTIDDAVQLSFDTETRVATR
jgi:hypothetical protein